LLQPVHFFSPYIIWNNNKTVLDQHGIQKGNGTSNRTCTYYWIINIDCWWSCRLWEEALKFRKSRGQLFL